MEAETIEVEEVKNLPALPASEHADIDIQISTARRFPRNVTTFKQRAVAMATLDVATAESCFYQLPRAGKTIDGPGIRLAEIVLSCWGNMRVGGGCVAIEHGHVICRGFAHDLENNTFVALDVRRRILDKYGKRYPEDMVLVTANAATSIALRNAIFRVVPRAYVDHVMGEAKKVAIGNATTLSTRRDNAIRYFQSLNVTQDRILAYLNKPGIEDVDLKDLEILVGLKTAIKDGDITVEEAFPDVPRDEAATQGKNKTETLLKKLKPETSGPKEKEKNGGEKKAEPKP